MNRQISRLAMILMGCFVVLFAQLNYIQVFRADSLNDHPVNSRKIVQTFNEPRGHIETTDGTRLAWNIQPGDGGRLEQQRAYHRSAELYSDVLGFYSFHYGTAGIERQFDDELRGNFSTSFRDVTELLNDDDLLGHIRLTIRSDLQAVAAEALNGRRGSVIALDVDTGAVLALYSNPTYDPSSMALLDQAAAAEARAKLLADEGKPLLAHSYQERYFPGSTFKMVSAASFLDNDIIALEGEELPTVRSYTPPLSEKAISNFGGRNCGGTLLELIEQSCNAGFAELAVRAGPDALINTAQDFGFNDVVPLDLPDVAESVFPTDFGKPLPREEFPQLHENSPALAQSALGQFNVQATPLQMALVAAAAANGGTLPVPHVLDEIVDSRGDLRVESSPGPWRKIAPVIARDLSLAMEGVVQNGTARGLRRSGVAVGAKTGTAEVSNGDDSHAWVIAFAGPNREGTSIALSVIVEAVPDGGQQTGGSVAVPVADRVFDVFFEQ